MRRAIVILVLLGLAPTGCNGFSKLDYTRLGRGSWQQPEKVVANAIQLMVRYLETGESYPAMIKWPDTPLITIDSHQE